MVNVILILPDGNFLYNRYYATEAGDETDVLEIPSDQDHSSFSRVYGGLFPTLGFGFHPTHLVVWHFVPKSVDRAVLRRNIYFSGAARTVASFETSTKGMLEYWTAVNREDEDICHFLQRGRGCPGYDGGRSAPYWDPGSLAFSRLVVKGMCS